MGYAAGLPCIDVIDFVQLTAARLAIERWFRHTLHCMTVGTSMRSIRYVVVRCRVLRCDRAFIHSDAARYLIG